MSQDILYIVLALCILWFTVFLCWLLYWAMRTVRNANRMVESIMHKIELIADAVDFIKHKVDNVSGHMGTVSRIASSLVDRFLFRKIEETFGDDGDEAPSKRKKRKL